MELADYLPLEHFPEVEALWRRALGDRYPISRRGLFPRLVTRSTLEVGDGTVAIDAGQVVGFGCIDIPRAAVQPGDLAGVQVILVGPAWRRRGVGTAILQCLERRARAVGVRQLVLTAGLDRFWSGVPDDLPEAQAFFTARGYELGGTCVDLNTPLVGYQVRPQYTRQLEAAGAAVVSATPDVLGAMLDFQTREFPGWRDAMVAMVAAGDLENVLLVKRQAQVIGSILTFTPRSRWRGPNLVWDEIHGHDMGGYGAVGIAKEWRGRGLGAAMCQAACLHVQKNGGTCAYIDWTGLVDFYAKTGAVVCRRFRRGTKTL